MIPSDLIAPVFELAAAILVDHPFGLVDDKCELILQLLQLSIRLYPSSASTPAHSMALCRFWSLLIRKRLKQHISDAAARQQWIAIMNRCLDQVGGALVQSLLVGMVQANVHSDSLSKPATTLRSVLQMRGAGKRSNANSVYVQWLMQAIASQQLASLVQLSPQDAQVVVQTLVDVCGSTPGRFRLWITDFRSVCRSGASVDVLKNHSIIQRQQQQRQQQQQHDVIFIE
eukprot:TRINITY_DN75336_c0_g1_i1.p1 TRINITY_DN75336_c0_g1~~TRINITY_DN75336_c0_g1_i1.p1  ORF type:complete len:250 (+),score=123.79 TRINITY_DN75336_c0_g1_i1:66-752(+)